MTSDEKQELYDKANDLQWELYGQDPKMNHILDSMLDIIKEIIEEMEIEDDK